MFLLPSASSTAAVAHWPNGQTGCPCIDPWTYNLDARNQAGHASVSDCDLIRKPDSYCYAASYGSAGCAAYDLTATPECSQAETISEWCSGLWCWVDVSACDVPHGHSDGWFANITYVPAADASLVLTITTSKPTSFTWLISPTFCSKIAEVSTSTTISLIAYAGARTAIVPARLQDWICYKVLQGRVVLERRGASLASPF